MTLEQLGPLLYGCRSAAQQIQNQWLLLSFGDKPGWGLTGFTVEIRSQEAVWSLTKCMQVNSIDRLYKV